MIKRAEYIIAALSGGIIYSLIEIMWRGFTHWSMTIAGGICFLFLHLLNKRLRSSFFFLRCLIGCTLITVIEFVFGVALNLWLGLGVWDYSDRMGNLLGQICPVFSALWFLLCVPAFIFSTTLTLFFEKIQQ